MNDSREFDEATTNPYASPGDISRGIAAAGPGMLPSFALGWGRFAVSMLAISSLVSASNIVLTIYSILLSTDPYVQETDWQRADWLYQVLDRVAIAVFLLTTVAFVGWMYVAHRRMTLLNTTPPRHHSHSAIWSWFVPVMSLFVPCQIMAELRIRSRATWEIEPVGRTVGRLVPWWWGTWLASGAIGTLSNTTRNYGEQYEIWATANGLWIAAQVVRIAAAVLAIALIVSINRNLIQRQAAFGSVAS